MSTILNIMRQQFKIPAYYWGTAFWLLASILFEVGRAYKGNPLQSLPYMLAGIFCIGVGFTFFAGVVQRLRREFRADDATVLDFVLALTWYSIKFVFVMMLFYLPMFIFAALNYRSAITEPYKFLGVIALFLLASIPFVMAMAYGGMALVIARAHSARSLIDSFRAFSYIWRETLICILLMLIPTIFTVPAGLLAVKFPAMTVIAAGLSICFTPYQFGLMCGTYVYLAKALIEKAPQLMPAATLANPGEPAKI